MKNENLLFDNPLSRKTEELYV